MIQVLRLYLPLCDCLVDGGVGGGGGDDVVYALKEN
jgi:hypothetical protein